MRSEGRAHHPARELVDHLMWRWFGRQEFDWLDVGVVGMVDYSRLRPRMGFRFVGADLSEPIADDARRYLERGEDRVIVWDIQDPPNDGLTNRFDLVTLRHVLNHCEYYERPLENAARLLRPGGHVIVTLHLQLVEGPDQLNRHRNWAVPGEVIGNRYGRDGFLRFFGRLFEPQLWVRLDDGRKPNDVIVGRRPTAGMKTLSAATLPMRRLWVAPGMRNVPRRILSRIAFALATRFPS